MRKGILNKGLVRTLSQLREDMNLIVQIEKNSKK